MSWARKLKAQEGKSMKAEEAQERDTGYILPVMGRGNLPEGKTISLPFS